MSTEEKSAERVSLDDTEQGAADPSPAPVAQRPQVEDVPVATGDISQHMKIKPVILKGAHIGTGREGQYILVTIKGSFVRTMEEFGKPGSYENKVCLTFEDTPKYFLLVTDAVYHALSQHYTTDLEELIGQQMRIKVISVRVGNNVHHVPRPVPLKEVEEAADLPL